MSITTLEQMIEKVQSTPKKRLIAAYANDSHTIGAVSRAIDLGMIEGTLVGNEKVIQAKCLELGINAGKFRIIQESDEVKSVMKAVELLNAGEGDVLMKGLVSTDKYMRAILNKECGLMNPGAILSHVTVVRPPNYPKLIIFGDVAIIPLPDLQQKVVIINNLIQTARALEIQEPKVALISLSEQVLPKIPSSADAALLYKMAERGQIKGAIIDGPLAFDLAVDSEAAQIKKIDSPVAGDADCLVFPNIEAGNVFYKSMTKFCKAEVAAVVMGARVPCVLSSRGDSELTKLYSIGLATLLTK